LLANLRTDGSALKRGSFCLLYRNPVSALSTRRPYPDCRILIDVPEKALVLLLFAEIQNLTGHRIILLGRDMQRIAGTSVAHRAKSDVIQTSFPAGASAPSA